MSSRILDCGDCSVEISRSLWSGRERIYRDGELVSEKWTLPEILALWRPARGTTHYFIAFEEGRPREYEVQIRARLGQLSCAVRRDGEEVVSDS